MKLVSMTNVRPTKDLGRQLVASPTPGTFKVSPDAAIALGIAVGDRVDIAHDPSDSSVLYIGKGSESNGAKVAKSGSYFIFSASNAWNSLGDSDHNTHYKVDEEAVMVPTGEEGEETAYFKLTFVERVAKQERGESGASNEGADQGTAAAAPAEEAAAPAETVEAAQGEGDFDPLADL